MRVWPWSLTIDLYHAMTWPELSYVAVNPKGEVVGYILAKMSVLFPLVFTRSSPLL